jgi:hypothetical protein
MSFNDKIIDELYESEVDQAVRELENVKFTASVEINDLAVIDAIASRFNITRTQLVRDVLHESSLRLFMGLKNEDKLVVGQNADAAIDEHIKKSSVEYESFGGRWESYAKICIEKDSKDA